MFNNMGFSMYDNDICFAIREYCILLFLKDSFSITPEPIVAIHLFPVCMCLCACV